jgi:hypothetical protein
MVHRFLWRLKTPAGSLPLHRLADAANTSSFAPRPRCLGRFARRDSPLDCHKMPRSPDRRPEPSQSGGNRGSGGAAKVPTVALTSPFAGLHRARHQDRVRPKRERMRPPFGSGGRGPFACCERPIIPFFHPSRQHLRRTIVRLRCPATHRGTPTGIR